MRSALGLVVVLAACVAPVQSGGVVMRPGAEGRLSFTCRFRHGDVGRDGCAAPASAAARVRRIETQADALRGALAIGRPGDYLLENDEIAIVIDALGAGIGFAESGGNIVDAGDAHTRSDELGQVFTYFGTFPRQAIYEHLDTGTEGDGTAWIRVTGHELYEADLSITTRYALKPGSRTLEMSTELQNAGKRALDAIDLGDAIQWGSTEKIAPGKPPGFTGDYAGPFVAGVGKRVAYALVPLAATGVTEPSVRARNGVAWTNATYAQKVELPPGRKARFDRGLVVAPRGDTAGVLAELLGDVSPGGVAFDRVDARGAKIERASGRVILTKADAAPPLSPWFRADDETGELGGELAPGRYTAHFEGEGRVSVEPVAFEVRAGAVTRATLALTDAARLHVTATEEGKATPAKIQIFDAGGARVRPPDLTARGAIDVGVVPGTYRIVASRGPEYALAEASVETTVGAPLDVKLTLHRVVDTPGYIACDLHQHTSWSADSGVSAADRVISNAAEGVECAVASEHNAVVDFAPIVKELGLEAFFRSIPGDELTTDASRVPWGHANVFPLIADPRAPRGGAIPVRDRSAAETFAAVRAMPGAPLIQVNHPRAPNRIGYFGELHFDRATGVGSAPDYDPAFDALEVWSGRHAKQRDEVLEDFWALLRTSHPVTPTANTDTHGIVGQEAGYPRTYVRVRDDDPAHLDVGALVEGIRVRRDVVLTNGPFVTVRAAGGKGDAVSGGGLVTMLPNRAVAIAVHVERAAWVDVSEMVVYVNGVAGDPIPLPAARPTPRGALANDAVIRVTRAPTSGRVGGAPRFSHLLGSQLGVEVEQDAFIAVSVRGKKPLEPVLFGDPSEILPFAMAAPVFIDVDGDGKVLGR